MNEDTFNMSMRKYLKQVGVTSQQAIERHVREHGDTTGKLSVRTVGPRDGACGRGDDRPRLSRLHRRPSPPTRSHSRGVNGRKMPVFEDFGAGR